MGEQTPTQKASAEMAASIVADPELRERFQLMAKETATRDPKPDDFAWLSQDAAPSAEFSRFKALTQKLFGVSKVDLHHDR
jgi:hypothetical protein